MYIWHINSFLKDDYISKFIPAKIYSSWLMAQIYLLKFPKVEKF